MRNRVALFLVMGLFLLAVVGAAIVADGGDDGGGDDALPKLPFSGAGSGTEQDSRSGAATASADIAIYPYGGVEYRLAKPLAKPAESGAGYETSPVDKADVDRLARGLGLNSPAKDNDGWVAKGATGELRVDHGTGSWYYGPGPDTAVSSSDAGSSSSSSPDIGECRPCPPDTICTMDCKPVNRPAGMPTQQEAEAAARAFWTKAGIDMADAKVTVEDHFSTWYVSAAVRHNGLPVVGVAQTVSVGPKSAVSGASGWIATADKLGDYPLLSVDDAVARLNNPPTSTWRGDAGQGRPEPAIAEDMPATDPGTASDPSAGASGGGSSGSTGSAGATEPAEPAKPVEPQPPVTSEPMPPMPEPEPQIVTLTGVELVLQFTGTHLVPAYQFTSDTQGIHVVAAVTDDLLDAQPRPEVLSD